MGMTCGLVRAAEHEIARLRTHPEDIVSFIDGDEWVNVSDVRRFAESLNALSAATLRERFDVQKMIALDIYPKTRAKQTSSREGELEHLVELFDQLRTFVEQSARDGEGLIVYLT